MASREHSCTRRAVLGAAVAMPVAAAAAGSERPSPPTASRRAPPLPRKAGEGEWASALEALRSAEAEVAAFERWAATPAWRPLEEREALEGAYGERV